MSTIFKKIDYSVLILCFAMSKQRTINEKKSLDHHKIPVSSVIQILQGVHKVLQIKKKNSTK